MTLRFARWAAVSSREQARKASLPDQLERALQDAQSKGWVESAGPFIVRGQSRQKYIQLYQAEQEIEAMRLMLAAARRGEFDILVMTEFDRLRVLLDQVFRTLASYKVQLYALAQPVEPVDPAEYTIHKADTILMLIAMAQTASSLEISRTRRKWYENMPKRITEHGLPATHIAYGYRKPIGRETDRKAVPEQNPALCRHILRVKHLFLKGHTTSQLVDYLTAHNVPPPHSQVWHKQTVRDILKNPFYAGIVQFGKSRVYLDPKTDTRKRNRSIPPEQIESAAGRHRPLWDETDHKAILAEFKRRSRSTIGRRNNQFTGLLKCGECNASLWRQGNGPRGEDRLIWRCSSTGSAVGHVNIPHSILVQKISDALEPILTRQIPQEGVRKWENERGDRQDYEAQIKDLNRQLERLETAYLQGEFELARYVPRKRRIEGEIAAVHAEMSAIEERRAQRNDWLKSIKKLKRPNFFPRWLREHDPAEVNHKLKLIIDKIVITGEKIEIKLK